MTGLHVDSESSGRRRARLGVRGWLRWSWRQLTSMRTALILLFLLALASVPGSVLPQEGIDPAAVSQYYQSHPALAPFLNRLSLFSVFAAPWFAAIYLLLFASLAGCVLPRTVRLVGSARQRPPRAPSNLARLPASASYRTDRAPADVLDSAAGMLGRRRFRLQPRRWLGLGREGVPARGRQPALPRRAPRLAVLGGPRRDLRLQGQPAADRRPGIREYAHGPRRLPARPPGQPGQPPAVLDQPAELPGAST